MRRQHDDGEIGLQVLSRASRSMPSLPGIFTSVSDDIDVFGLELLQRRCGVRRDEHSITVLAKLVFHDPAKARIVVHQEHGSGVAHTSTCEPLFGCAAIQCGRMGRLIRTHVPRSDVS